MKAQEMIKAVLEGKSPDKVIDELREGYSLSIKRAADVFGYLDAVTDEFEELAASWEMSDPENDQTPPSFDSDWQKVLKAVQSANNAASNFIKRYGKYLG